MWKVSYEGIWKFLNRLDPNVHGYGITQEMHKDILMEQERRKQQLKEAQAIINLKREKQLPPESPAEASALIDDNPPPSAANMSYLSPQELMKNVCFKLHSGTQEHNSLMVMEAFVAWKPLGMEAWMWFA